MITTTLVIVVFAIAYLYLPDIKGLLRVGTGFTAKTVCSGIFVSHRTAESIVTNELQGIAATILSFTVDRQHQKVDAFAKFLSPEISALLALPHATAYYLGPQLGCRLGHDSVPREKSLQGKSLEAKSAPETSLSVEIDPHLQSFLDAEVTSSALIANQTRGAIILYRGNVVAEAYQRELGITKSTRLLGWSMTKSAHAMVVGAAIQAQLLNLTSPVSLSYLPDAWKHYLLHRNNGQPLTFADLLAMADVLPFPEDYNMMKDVPRMLFARADAGAYAGSVSTRAVENISITHSTLYRKDNEVPAATPVSNRFDWYYSSGVSNILAKELRQLFSSDEEYWSFPHKSLFDRIGAHSFTLETDPSGTFVASSFSYASIRDWARLGQLLLQNGKWNGETILSKEYIDFLRTPHPSSGGHYGGSFWLNPRKVSVAEYNFIPMSNKNKIRNAWLATTLPADAYYMSGHEGQFVVVVPSLELVMVRLGFTPDSKDGTSVWDKKHFFGTIADYYYRKQRVTVS